MLEIKGATFVLNSEKIRIEMCWRTVLGPIFPFWGWWLTGNIQLSQCNLKSVKLQRHQSFLLGSRNHWCPVLFTDSDSPWTPDRCERLWDLSHVLSVIHHIQENECWSRECEYFLMFTLLKCNHVIPQSETYIWNLSVGKITTTLMWSTALRHYTPTVSGLLVILRLNVGWKQTFLSFLITDPKRWNNSAQVLKSHNFSFAQYRLRSHVLQQNKCRNYECYDTYTLSVFLGS